MEYDFYTLIVVFIDHLLILWWIGPFTLTLVMSWTWKWLGLLEFVMLLHNSLYYDDNEWVIG